MSGMQQMRLLFRLHRSIVNGMAGQEAIDYAIAGSVLKLTIRGDSNLVTSSRVLARLPGGWDTNTRDDFFITEPRKSTFGYPNEYYPYEP